MKHVKKAIPVLLVALSAAACSGKKKTSAAKMGTVMDSATSSMPMQGSAGMADSGAMKSGSGMMKDTSAMDGSNMKSGSGGMAADTMMDPHVRS